MNEKVQEIRSKLTELSFEYAQNHIGRNNQEQSDLRRDILVLSSALMAIKEHPSQYEYDVQRILDVLK